MKGVHNHDINVKHKFHSPFGPYSGIYIMYHTIGEQWVSVWLLTNMIKSDCRCSLLPRLSREEGGGE